MIPIVTNRLVTTKLMRYDISFVGVYCELLLLAFGIDLCFFFIIIIIGIYWIVAV